jgi:glycosyltransferase involved in cell wall biosynthesis
MVVLSQYPGDPRVRREAEALSRDGIAVDIICYQNPGQSSTESFGNITAYRVIPVRDKTSILKYFLFTMIFSFAAHFKLLSLSIQNRYAAVQIHNMPDILVFVAFWHRLFGVPLVLDLHDLMVELFESKWSGGKSRVLLPWVRIMEKVSCAFSHHLITTSEGFRQKLLLRGIPDEKITLVLNSADNHIFYRPADGAMARQARDGQVLKAPRLVYHGTITHRFGIHVLIEAVAELKSQGLAPTLQLHGKYDEDYRPYLEDLIGARGLKDDVSLGGYLLHEEIRELLYDCDIGIVPYLSDSFMELALSTKSFEYVAMGLPVVASRVAAMTSIFGDQSVRYFEAGHSRQLASQIQAFCEDPQSRVDFSREADLEYEQWAWPQMEQRYKDLMVGLMKPDKQ